MRKSILFVSIVVAWAALCWAPLGQRPRMRRRGVAGKWLGSMTVPGATLRMAFEISPSGEGGYTAVVHSIDQGAMNIPMTSATLNGGQLRLELANVFAYEGSFQPDGETIDGRFVQGGDSLPLVLKRVDTIPELGARPRTRSGPTHIGKRKSPTTTPRRR